MKRTVIVGAAAVAMLALTLVGCSSSSKKSRYAPTTVPGGGGGAGNGANGGANAGAANNSAAGAGAGATAKADATASATTITDAAALGDAKRTREGDLYFETVTVNGTEVEYALVLPPNYDAGKPAPVLFAFPPGGQDHETTAQVTSAKYAPEAVKQGWVVLSPVASVKGLYYDGEAAALVPPLLDALAARYPPEGGKFFLAGVSNGGLSAFRAALDHPERFRSLVVFPGVPPEAADVDKLAVLKPIPVSMFVGGDDSGWREQSQATKFALARLGARVTLDIRAGEGHIIRSLTSAQLFDALNAARSIG